MEAIKRYRCTLQLKKGGAYECKEDLFAADLDAAMEEWLETLRRKGFKLTDENLLTARELVSS